MENPVGQALDNSPEASVDGLNQSDLGNDRNAARQRSGGGLMAAFALLLALAAAVYSFRAAVKLRATEKSNPSNGEVAERDADGED